MGLFSSIGNTSCLSSAINEASSNLVRELGTLGAATKCTGSNSEYQEINKRIEDMKREVIKPAPRLKASNDITKAPVSQKIENHMREIEKKYKTQK